jgi:CBS domain containing-hemolysin-like protein
VNWGEATVPILAALAVLLFVVDFLLSLALLSVVSVSRVALQRMSTDSEGTLAFLEDIRSPSSAHRLAAHILRQMSLVGAAVAVGLIGAIEGWPYPWAIGAGAAGVIGVLLLEILAARIIALRRPKATLKRVAPLYRPLRILMYPIVVPLQRLLSIAEEQEGGSEEEAEEDQEEEVEAYFEVGEREGILEAEEGKMMRSIVDLGETLVREIMTPRPDIQAIAMGSTVGDARRAILEKGHTKLPVYREEIDNIVGVLHLRDLVRAWHEDDDGAPLTPYLRNAYFVPETQLVSDLLSKLRTKTNMAIVVDEYGGIAGLVTLEDILEEIVGDIRDEHDSDEELIREETDGSWLLSGLVHVEKLEDMYGVEFQERDFDTVGGLVVSHLGRVPAKGEELDHEGIHITIVEADPRRVYQVRVRGDLVPGYRRESP